MSYRDHDGGPQEIELEQLFRAMLPETVFANRVYAVGGYVRDELLGLEPADLDVAVELPYGAQRLLGFLQDHFEEALSEPTPLTLDYPIWYVRFQDDVVFEGEPYSVAGAELDLTDTQTLEQLNGDTITRFGPVSDDVQRRDYTVGMLYKDLTTGEILDPTGLGKADIEKGLLRAHPGEDLNKAFAEHPKLMLRVVRFMVQYGWEAVPEVMKALRQSAKYLADVSGHGLEKEFTKLYQRGLLDRAIPIFHDFGMWEPLREAWRQAKEEE